METKVKLMDVAFTLFAEKGNEFALSEVAGAVGIQKASIYAHFGSREELLYAVINREITAYFFEINEHCQDLKSMYLMILNYYERSKTKLYFWKRLLLFPPVAFETTLSAKISDLSQQRYDLVREIIRRDMAQGTLRLQDPEAVAVSFFSMIHGILSSRIIYAADTLEQHYEALWDIFLHGVTEKP